jgi:hypothetical protein
LALPFKDNYPYHKMDSSQLKAFWADLLSKSLSCFGFDSSSRVLDCCARDTGFVFALMDHFTHVGSNDLSKQCPTQTHFDIQDPAYWSTIQAKYAGIVTQPPRNTSLIITIINNAFSIGTKFCALLLSKFDNNTNFLLQCPPSLIVLVDGLQQSLFLWLNPAVVGTRVVSLTGDIVTAYQSEPGSFGETIRAEVTRVFQVSAGFNLHEPTYSPLISCVTTSALASNTGLLSHTTNTQVAVASFPLHLDSSPFSSKSAEDESSTDIDQKTLLYLKGIAAANQGQALQEYIEKYSNVFSKREVITKVCKMKYRSAQRKLRIAKYIASYPEISTMTQRQAEKYITEKLKQNKHLKATTRRKKSKEAEQNALFQNLAVY